MKFYLHQLAASYDCNAYGSGDYNSTSCTTAATGSEGLVPTGTDVMVGVTGGILLIVTALAILFKTRSKKTAK